MRKLVLLSFLVAVCAPAALAQTTGDYDKVNVFLGYSHMRADTGISVADGEASDILNKREGLHGVNASVTGNLSRYFGLKGDYSFHRRTFNIVDGSDTFSINVNLHNLVGGVQFKNNAKESKVRPFAHVMAGVAHATFKVTDFAVNDSETGFSGIIGAGLDFRVNDRVDVRAIQFDYNPTHLGGETQHNFRIGVGIVIK